MTSTYAITPEQAATLVSEYKKRLPRHELIRWLLPLLALALAVGYARLEPIEATINNQPSRTFSLALAVFIQIPIVAAVFYGILRLLGWAWTRGLEMAIRKTPREIWGQRELSVSKDDIKIRSNLGTRTIRTSFIDNVVETTSGLHLRHGDYVMLRIPKTACTLDELNQAMKT